ncbi:MAG: response regulator [Defluviitaleaceae bacterium]|nr:response regulator [Defluviitaleaceae bacterium]
MDRKTVMIVEDVQVNIDFLEGILFGTYNVITALSGAQALELLKNGADPDIFLLDLIMPEMDGFELLEEIQKNKKYAKIPAIFVTSEDGTYAEEKGLSLGAVDYITKPYTPAIIYKKIHNHIELKTYRDNLSKAVEMRTKELTEAHSAIIMGMSLMSESHDQVTGSHLLRIKELTEILAAKFHERHPDLMSEKLKDLIVTYSPLHDVGKVSVPDAVLKKNGKLTDEEFDQMKSHTSGGGDLLRQLAKLLNNQNHLEIAIEIAECHHERYDGTGYPLRLSGDDIPLSARIVSIVDIYDALRSARPYKRAFTHEESMSIIVDGDGRTMPTHFDPRILNVFKEVHKQICEAYDNNPDPHVFEE